MYKTNTLTNNSNEVKYDDKHRAMEYVNKLGNKKHRFTAGKVDIEQPGYIRMTDGNVLITGTVREVF